MDWEYLEQQSRIVDIKDYCRLPSKVKCKIIDADKKVIKKLKVTSGETSMVIFGNKNGGCIRDGKLSKCTILSKCL